MNYNKFAKEAVKLTTTKNHMVFYLKKVVSKTATVNENKALASKSTKKAPVKLSDIKKSTKVVKRKPSK